MASRLIIFLFIVFTVTLSQGLMEEKLLPTRQDTLREVLQLKENGGI